MRRVPPSILGSPATAGAAHEAAAEPAARKVASGAQEAARLDLRSLRRVLLLGAAVVLLCLPSTSAASGAGAGDPVLGPGSGFAATHGSQAVRELQRRLHGLGQEPGPIDGLYGPHTQAAVAGFQRTRGLRVDGVVGPETTGGLSAAGGSRGVLALGSGYADGASAAVRSLQHRLRGLSRSPGPVDGLYGPRTAAAVADFQRSHGLAVDGVLGPQTTRKLIRRHAGRAPARAGPDARVPQSPRPHGHGADRAPPESASPNIGTTGSVLLMAAAAAALLLAFGRLLRRPAGSKRVVGTRLNLGLVCAALLASFGIGAASGALFATRAAPDESKGTAGVVRARIPVREGAAPAGSEGRAQRFEAGGRRSE